MHRQLFLVFQYLVTPKRLVDWFWKPAILGVLSTAMTMLMYEVIDLALPMPVVNFYIFVTAISLPFFLLGMKISLQNVVLQEKLKRMALTDLLTGLDNRRAFFKKASGKQGAILMMDVDRFKRVNDTFGHDVGDVVLKEIAQHLKACVRSGDYLARFGGEEFAVLLLDADTPQAREIGERITKGVDIDPVGSVTISVGVVGPTDWQGDVAAAFKKADRALYAAKHRGRACAVVWPIETLAA